MLHNNNNNLAHTHTHTTHSKQKTKTHMSVFQACASTSSIQQLGCDADGGEVLLCCLFVCAGGCCVSQQEEVREGDVVSVRKQSQDNKSQHKNTYPQPSAAPKHHRQLLVLHAGRHTRGTCHVVRQPGLLWRPQLQLAQAPQAYGQLLAVHVDLLAAGLSKPKGREVGLDTRRTQAGKAVQHHCAVSGVQQRRTGQQLRLLLFLVLLRSLLLFWVVVWWRRCCVLSSRSIITNSCCCWW